MYKKKKVTKEKLDKELKNVNGGDDYNVFNVSSYEIWFDTETGDFTKKPIKKKGST